MRRLAAMALLAVVLAGCTAATAREPERPKRWRVVGSWHEVPEVGEARFVQDTQTGACYVYMRTGRLMNYATGGPATAPASACEAQQR